MKKLTLSNRLNTIAAKIGDRAGVADVGTDHGFLPVWIAQHGAARRIVATDIRPGPLGSAKASAAEYGCSDRIEFVLTDGLNGVDPAGLDTVVIAGMGGENIIHILEDAPWTKSEDVLCVLQPQTKTDDLAAYLKRSGFIVHDAALAYDDRYYLIMSAAAGNGDDYKHPLEILFGKRDPLLPGYLAWLIGTAQRALGGLAKAENKDETELLRLRSELDRLVTLKEETERWSRSTRSRRCWRSSRPSA
jgi:tRNA (adenine22-N1)-methyltransferase